LVQIFTGNGKGKTTTALGMIFRAAGEGHNVFIVFFIKGKYSRGEYDSLARLPNVTTASFVLQHLIDPKNISPEEKGQAEAALAAAREAVLSGEYDLVVLDEVNVALEYKLIELEKVVEIINNKPRHVELILTGRYADKRLVGMADAVTEMVKVKHPFDSGVSARKGIEY
jgi:cob(I)alamin adenosyltransferase